MDYSMPGSHVHNQLLELAQTHVYRVSDAIQPSYPLLFLSPSDFNLSQVRVFSSESVLRIRSPKYWNFSFNISPPNEHSGLISLRMDWLEFLAVQETLKASPTTQFKGINSSVISFPYNATLTSIHDHWKNHSLD